jgi:hypothetical protein
MVVFAKSAPRVYKVVLTTLGIIRPYSVKRHNPSTSLLVFISEDGASFVPSLTHTSKCTSFEDSSSCKKKETRGACSVLDYSWWFGLSLGIVSEIYY